MLIGKVMSKKFFYLSKEEGSVVEEYM